MELNNNMVQAIIEKVGVEGLPGFIDQILPNVLIEMIEEFGVRVITYAEGLTIAGKDPQDPANWAVPPREQEDHLPDLSAIEDVSAALFSLYQAVTKVTDAMEVWVAEGREETENA